MNGLRNVLLPRRRCRADVQYRRVTAVDAREAGELRRSTSRETMRPAITKQKRQEDAFNEEQLQAGTWAAHAHSGEEGKERTGRREPFV